MRNRVGREAINLLKNYYENGDGCFNSIYEIKDYLKHQRIKCTLAQVQGWDRQARMERHDAGQSITHPSKVNGFVRQASPAAAERIASRTPRLKDTASRVQNDVRVAKADAAQPDADAIERARVALLEQAQNLIGAATGLS